MRNRINIIITGKFSYPQGMAGTKRVQHFVDYLKSRDMSVALLLVSRGINEILKHQSSGCYKGVSYRKIGSNLKLNFSLLWQMPIFVWDGFRCLAKWKKQYHKNIFFCYGGPNIENISLICLANLLGYKIVFDIVEDYSVIDYEVNLLSKIKISSLIFLEKCLRFLADGLVVISRHLYDKYAKSLKHEDAIKLIPVSAKVEEIDHKRKFNNPVRIVYSGSFACKDGVDNLIEAFEDVYQRNNGVVLLMTGKGADENITRIKQKISGNIAIRYLGYLKDKEFYSFLREADILCMTRTGTDFANAGFPFKLGEYLATGNPVIASASSDVRYYLENMKDAVLIEPGVVAEIRNAIEFLVQEQETAMEIGRSGREKCRQYFDPEKNGDILMDLLYRV